MAALSRPFLRDQHARLRLGRAAREVRAAPRRMSAIAAISITCSARWSPSSRSARLCQRRRPRPAAQAARRRCSARASSSMPRAAATASRSILPGQNDEERYRSPLTEVGVDVHEGDYILAINGQPLAAKDNPYPPAAHRAGPARAADRQYASGPGRRAHRAGQADRQRRAAESTSHGSSTTANTSRRRPTASSATCTSPTWAATASASSSSGTIRSCASRASSSTCATTAAATSRR